MYSSRSPFSRQSSLVGREKEIGMLSMVLEEARTGQGGVVVLAGEAGIGKSRLVAEVKVLAEKKSFTALLGSCFEPDRALPYAPLLDLVRTLCATCTPNELLKRLHPYATDLIKLLPELAAYWPDVPPAPTLEPEQEKRRLFQTLIRFFTDFTLPLKGNNAQLIIIEDLHWSDDMTLEFLLQLARRVKVLPILLLLTYRNDEATPALTHFLASLDRERLAHEAILARLIPGEVEAMIRATFDQQHPVRADFVEALHALTDGNPFFIEEILNALVAAGDIFFVDGRWTRKPLSELRIPRTVQEAVQRRTQQLNVPTQQTLQFAAAIGQRFDFALLQHLVGLSETDLLQQLKDLMDAQLVVEESADHFAFRHALTRNAIYHDLLARERRPLHRQIAQAMEQLYGASFESHTTELSDQFFAAGVWAKAQLYARRAAKHAVQLHAPQAAVEHYTRAIEAISRIAQPLPAEGEGETLAQLHHARGKAYDILGEYEAAYGDYTRAAHLAQAAGDTQLEWQCLLDLGFLQMSRDYGRAKDYLQRALQRARAMGDPITLGHTLNRIGNWHMMAGTPDEGRKFHDEALLIFEAANDKSALASTLDLLGTMHALTADNISAAQYYERAIPLFREVGDFWGLSSAMAMHGELGGHYMCDSAVGAAISLASCLREGEEALVLARRVNARPAEAYAALQAAFGLGPRGEFDRAAEMAHLAEQIGMELQHTVFIGSGRMAYGRLLYDFLAYERAQEVLSAAREAAYESQSTLIMHAVSGSLANTLIALGLLDRAQSVLVDILTGRSDMQNIGTRTAWGARMELALAGGQAQEAFDLAERLIAHTPQTSSGGVVPRLWRLRAKALTMLGRYDDVQAGLETARNTARNQELPHELWRIEAALGKLHHTQSHLEEARRHYAVARAVVDSLAAKVSDETIRAQFIQRATAMIPTLPSPSPTKVAKAAFGGLTAREREVAAWLAQGLSNKAIAEKLVLSERTVEKHVEKVMGKLGFTSRTQAAVWATEKLAQRS